VNNGFQEPCLATRASGIERNQPPFLTVTTTHFRRLQRGCHAPVIGHSFTHADKRFG